MADIIPIDKPKPKPKKKPPDIWRCKCKSIKFWVYKDGSIQCSECDTFQKIPWNGDKA